MMLYIVMVDYKSQYVKVIELTNISMSNISRFSTFDPQFGSDLVVLQNNI